MDADVTEPGTGFGQRLKVAINHSGLTYAELERRSHVSRWTIKNWECERTRPEMGKLRSVASVLGLRAEDLLGIEPDDGAINTVPKFLAWLEQMYYQQITNVRRVIEAEIEQRVAEELAHRSQPRQALAQQEAESLVREAEEAGESQLERRRSGGAKRPRD